MVGHAVENTGRNVHGRTNGHFHLVFEIGSALHLNHLEHQERDTVTVRTEAAMARIGSTEDVGYEGTISGRLWAQALVPVDGPGAQGFQVSRMSNGCQVVCSGLIHFATHYNQCTA